MNKLLVLISILFIAGCGSRETNNREKVTETPDDTVSEDTVYQTPSDSVSVIDTLVTRRFSEEADTSELIHKSGTLNYSGNEPFVTPTLFVSDNESYRLMADEVFMKDTFKNINGRNATIYGKEVAMGNSTMLEVHYYELDKN